jgi:outer membrane protein assembly factor BamB
MNSIGHKLFCLFPDGKIKWEYAINNNAKQRPVIDQEGNIYIFTYSDIKGTLLSISKEGTLNWQHQFKSINWCDPVISKEGIIYIGLNVPRTLCAFNKNGEMLWEKLIGQGLGTNFMNIKEDGTIYVCLNNALHALDSDGNIKWTYKPDSSNIIETPALARNGILYLNRTPHLMTALDSDGNELWSTDIKDYVIQAPIVGSNEKIMQVCFRREGINVKSFIKVYMPDGKKLWEYEIEGTIVSAFLADDNLIYVITNIYDKKKWTENTMKVRWDFLAIGKE